MCDFENYQLWDSVKSAKRDKKYPTGHTYRRTEKGLKNFNRKLNGLQVNIHEQDFKKAKFVAKLDDQEYIFDLTKMKKEQNEELFSIDKRKNWLLPEILSNLNHQVYFKMDKACETMKTEIVKEKENTNYKINSKKIEKSENEIDEIKKNMNKNKNHQKKISKSQKCYKMSALLDNETNKTSINNQINENVKAVIKINRKHRPEKKIQLKPDEENKNKSDHSEIPRRNKWKESRNSKKYIEHKFESIENQQTKIFSVKFYETTKSYDYNNYTKEKLPDVTSVKKFQKEPILSNINNERSLLPKKAKLKTFNETELNRGRNFIKKLLGSFVEINDDFSLNYKPLFGIRAFEDRCSISQKFCVELNRESDSNFTKIGSAHNSNEVNECNICCDESNSSLLRLEPCSHIACSKCWEEYCTKTIDSFKTIGMNNGKVKQLSCLYQGCDTILGIKTLSLVLPQIYITKYIDNYTELSIISNDKYVICNNDKCDKIIITSNKSPVAICQCDTAICKKCGQDAHYPASCQLYASYRKLVPLKNNGNKLDLISWIDTVTGRHCPKCQKFFERASGCDRIRCICGTQFCWRCLEIYNHLYHLCDYSIEPVTYSEITLFEIPNLRVLQSLQEKISQSDNLLLELQKSNFIDTLDVTLDKNSKKIYQFLLSEHNLNVNMNEIIKRCFRQFHLNLMQMLSITSAVAIEEVTKQYLILKRKLIDEQNASSAVTEEFNDKELKLKLEFLIKQTTYCIKYYEAIIKLLPNVTNIYRFYDLVIHNQKMKNLVCCVSSSNSIGYRFTKCITYEKKPLNTRR